MILVLIWGAIFCLMAATMFRALNKDDGADGQRGGDKSDGERSEADEKERDIRV